MNPHTIIPSDREPTGFRRMSINVTDSSTATAPKHQARIDAHTSSADNYSQSNDLVDLIANYTPSMISRSRWVTVAEFTRSAVTDFAPRHTGEARNALFAVGRLADWTHHVAGHPLDRTIVFNGRNIDDFVKNGYPVAEAKRKGNMRHLLHRISAEFGTGDETRRRARRVPNYDQSAPYTEHDLAEFRLTGKTASTPKRQHNWLLTLALGAGFGIANNEVFSVRAEDVVQDERGVVLKIRGSAPREVVCLPEWESELLARVEARRGEPWLLDIDELPARPSTWMAEHLANAAGANRKFTSEWLRTTWIVRHLTAGTHPQVIMRALGVNTTKAIDRGLMYVPRIADADYFSALRLGGQA